MKISKKFTAVALIAAMALIAGCGGGEKKADAPKGADKKVTLKLAAQLPASHWLVKNMDSLKNKVAAKTNNTVDIQISAAGAWFVESSCSRCVACDS